LRLQLRWSSDDVEEWPILIAVQASLGPPTARSGIIDSKMAATASSNAEVLDWPDNTLDTITNENCILNSLHALDLLLANP